MDTRGVPMLFIIGITSAFALIRIGNFMEQKLYDWKNRKADKAINEKLKAKEAAMMRAESVPSLTSDSTSVTAGETST